MGQILQLAGIVLDGAVLFYFLSDGILKRKRLALYIILYLLATFFGQDILRLVQAVN